MSSKFSTAELPAARLIPACDGAIAHSRQFEALEREEFIRLNTWPPSGWWIFRVAGRTREEAEKLAAEVVEGSRGWGVLRASVAVIQDHIAGLERLREFARAATAHDPAAVMRVTTADWDRVGRWYEAGDA